SEYIENASNVTGPIQAFFQRCGIVTTEDAQHGHRRRAIVKVGFHSLRHSFVSLCAKARAPQHVVQQLVGHGSPAMTEHYTHLDPAQKSEAIAALPAIVVSTEDAVKRESKRGRPAQPKRAGPPKRLKRPVRQQRTSKRRKRDTQKVNRNDR